MAIKRAVFEREPWVVLNIIKAFIAANDIVEAERSDLVSTIGVARAKALEQVGELVSVDLPGGTTIADLLRVVLIRTRSCRGAGDAVGGS